MIKQTKENNSHRKAEGDAQKESAGDESGFLRKFTTRLNYLCVEHWATSAIFIIALGFVAFAVQSVFSKITPITWGIIGGSVIAAYIALAAAHLILKRPTKKPSKFGIPEDLRATFKQLRNSFESLALQSKGLHHVLTELRREEGVGALSDDCNPPVFTLNRPGDPRNVFSFDTPPGDSVHPRALTDVERASIPTKKERDRYVRDIHGRPLALWEPTTVRMGYMYGDNNVFQQFRNISEAAGTAILQIPTECLSLLPSDIQPLCRHEGSGIRRYHFGIIPSQPTDPISQGWAAGIIQFDEGAIVDCPSGALGSGGRSPAWALLLHRLGWASRHSSMLHACRHYWLGNTSVELSLLKVFPDNPILPKVPMHRFYSTLSVNGGSAMDVCWASAWAIDELLKQLC